MHQLLIQNMQLKSAAVAHLVHFALLLQSILIHLSPVPSRLVAYSTQDIDEGKPLEPLKGFGFSFMLTAL